MFRTPKQLADHELRLASLSLAVAELRRSTNPELLKMIEALQADVDTIRISLRSLHGKVAYEKRRETPAAGRVDDEPDDEEFQRLINLQRSSN